MFRYFLVLTAWLAPAQVCPPAELNQNWDRPIREKFWFTPQGSRILPYSWFLALETAWNEQLFRDKHILDDLLGFIAVSPSPMNQAGLPIGFTWEQDESGRAWVGLTCAACHTAKLDIGGRMHIIEGAPAGSDFATFLSWLVDSLQATVAGDEKFRRFATRVLGSGASESVRQTLRSELQQETNALAARRARNHHPEPYGYARVDAFGHIMNELLAKDLNIPANRRDPDAPVSYPFLWDTPHHERVQWNGVAPNTSIASLGPLFRNIGEVIGVFGRVDIKPRQGFPPVYSSSIHKANLRTLEDMLWSLWSPQWPSGCHPIDANKVQAGKQAFAKAKCAECHADIVRDARDRKANERLIAVRAVGTDPTMADNFISRQAQTGKLQGTPKRFPLFIRGNFGDTGSAADILGNAALGIYFGQGLRQPGPLSLDPGPIRDQIETLLDIATNKDAVYKARPLNGIWATAPYLHNGSVPNLRQLLKKPEQRMSQFHVGSRKFDPVNVGLSTEKDSQRGFLFDTSKKGNRNTGHPYGTDLSDSEKDALVEYLKTL